MVKCERCKEKGNLFKMSYFNTEMLCPSCQLTEQAHPDYAKAVKVELEEVRKRNFNFPGIGLPKDLVR